MDSGHIEKNNDNGNYKLVKEKKALKTGFKKQFKGKCHVCGKAQIVGHWIVIKQMTYWIQRQK